MVSLLWFLASMVLVGLFAYSTQRNRKRHDLPLPPGPRPKPIIGNLRDLPSPNEQDWQHWLKHKELYGPISSLRVLGKRIIILNDAQLAVQLLEKRSAIHSSRPQQNFTEMSGWHNVLGALRNPEHIRMTRKYLHQEIGSNNSVACFNDVQITEVSRFLLRVMNDPERLQQHIRKEAGGIVLKVAYGYTISPHSPDPLVDLADKAMEDFSYALLPTAWAVDFIPILRYLPAWFPGAGFIKICQAYKTRAVAFSDVPYKFVQQQMDTKAYVPSFLSNLLRKCDVEPGSEEERIIKWSAGSLYAGGADTTVSAIASFFLAMAFYPEVQRKAQQELDSVVGVNTLVQFEDRAKLPYINALVKEVLRWHPVVPTNIPHVSTQDDTCEGYLIPKGSSIVANIWGFTHDANIYSDPMAFRPERFLTGSAGQPPERDPHMLVFGFGRRACPGRTLADSNIFLTIAQSLSVFEISKPLKSPEVQDFDVKFLPGVISHPAPFKVSIQPRSSAHRDLIQSLEHSFPWESGDAELLSSVQ
ncbi:hypothetical protein N7507_002842 [Penicillium longicatenatum]|nr:hypothetical protein N7507_002842 [Penicillium longicatenatum]